MAKKKVEAKVLYIIIDNENNVIVRKYLSKVEDLTGILKTTLSKHFNNFKVPYIKSGYTIHKSINVDLKGYYKNNFR